MVLVTTRLWLADEMELLGLCEVGDAHLISFLLLLLLLLLLLFLRVSFAHMDGLCGLMLFDGLCLEIEAGGWMG